MMCYLAYILCIVVVSVLLFVYKKIEKRSMLVLRFCCLMWNGRLFLFEIIFANATEGAYPVGWDVFECGARGNAAIGVAVGGVIDVATNFANVLFHFCLVFDG